MIDNVEFLPDFVDEARGHIQVFEQGLLSMTNGDGDNEIINSLFRAVHSIKGTAGFFNLSKIVELSHSMENLMGEIRSLKIEISSEIIDVLLIANDCIKNMVENVTESEEIEVSYHVDSINYFLNNPNSKKNSKSGNSNMKKKASKPIVAITDETVPDPEDGNTIQAKPDESEPLKNSLDANIDANIDDNKDQEIELEKDKVIDKEIDEDKEIVPIINKTEDLKEDEHKSEEVKDKKTATASSNKFEDNVRVNVSLLNKLLNLASEMVLGRNQLLRSMEKFRYSENDIDHILQNIDMITSELQETVMQTRMQPLSNVFGKFPRLIRDLSKKLGKDIELTVIGDGIELDKSIIEALSDPMTHLIRNAADHGIESPKKRQENGKHRAGAIEIRAYQEGGYVNIDIKDDGNGVDIERVKKKAIEKGLISKHDLLSLSESDALKLLFQPGFSTSDSITDVSGRGVGMDVVRSNIEKMGGSIEIYTKFTKGTTFRLLLPLTLAIIPSVIVEVENQKFALPQVNLQEIVRIGTNEVSKKIEYINNCEVIRLRGGLLPIIHLADILGIKKTYVDPRTGERKSDKRKTVIGPNNHNVDSDDKNEITGNLTERNIKNTIKVLVIKIGNKKIGTIVDAIHGSEEILVKQLPYYIKNLICYSGVTIMGDGKVAMILDPQGIIKKAHLRFSDKLDEKSSLKFVPEEVDLREQQSLILFKSTGDECFGMDLSQVSRVEKIWFKDVERVGDHEYIKFRNQTLRLVHLEQYLPVSSQYSEKEIRYVIIPKYTLYPLGILVEEIIDTISTTIKINQDDTSCCGIIGSTIINKKIVLLLDVYEIFEQITPDYMKNQTPPSTPKNHNILLVEDTPFFLKMEKNYLETGGYNVLTATNGQEALKVLMKSDISALVSDIQMPVMDGIELIKRVRTENQFKDLPAVALTSLTGNKNVAEIINAGYDLYEQKLDRVKLLDDLEKLILKRSDQN